MKRLLVSLLLCIGLPLVAGPSAVAEPSGDCGALPADGGMPDGNVYARVCVAGVGSLTAADAGNYGYIVADGDSGNAAINQCLDGYIGIEGDTSGNFNTVSSPDGDYAPPRHGAGASPDPTVCTP